MANPGSTVCERVVFGMRTGAVVLRDYRGELAEDLRAGTGLPTNLLLTLTAFNPL